MELKHATLDLSKYDSLERGVAHVMPRDGATWLVREVPVGLGKGDGNDWSVATDTDMFRIPLVAYRGLSNDPAELLAFAFQLGIRAREEAGMSIEPHKLMIVIGSPLEEIHQGGQLVGYRFWAGFAFACELKLADDA